MSPDILNDLVSRWTRFRPELLEHQSLEHAVERMPLHLITPNTTSRGSLNGIFSSFDILRNDLQARCFRLRILLGMLPFVMEMRAFLYCR